MTMTDDRQAVHPLGTQLSEPGAARAAINQMIEAGLLDDVMARADAGELRLTGEGGFLPEMIKAVPRAGSGRRVDRPSGLREG
jgi:putative transposase